jgi:CheY-like chemotaxis protein
MILLVSRDLMAISTVSGAARNLGMTLRAADNCEAIAGTTPDVVSLVAIDLASIHADIANIVSRIRADYPQATIVAFGPHVGTHELHLATVAGCDKVMARGQFLGQLNSILALGSRGQAL